MVENRQSMQVVGSCRATKYRIRIVRYHTKYLYNISMTGIHINNPKRRSDKENKLFFWPLYTNIFAIDTVALPEVTGNNNDTNTNTITCIRNGPTVKRKPLVLLNDAREDGVSTYRVVKISSRPLLRNPLENVCLAYVKTILQCAQPPVY